MSNGTDAKEPNPKPIETEGELEKELYGLLQQYDDGWRIDMPLSQKQAVEHIKTLIAREREAGVREVKTSLIDLLLATAEHCGPELESRYSHVIAELQQQRGELKGTQPHE